jgi:hypothetical protein
MQSKFFKHVKHNLQLVHFWRQFAKLKPELARTKSKSIGVAVDGFAATGVTRKSQYLM